jgi:excisionase family DNA binding protein
MTDAQRHTFDGLMDVADVAAYTRLSTHTIRKHAQRGTIPVVRLGRRILFRRDEIDAWIESERTKSAA